MKKIIFLTVLLLVLITQKSNAQSTTASNTYALASYLGWSTSNTLPFKLAGVQYMTLGTSGYLGIGITSPAHLLDIYGGDVNVGSSLNNTGYMIGGQYVVWHNGQNSAIYLGVGAGGGVGYNPTGVYNTVIGGDAGYDLGLSSSSPGEWNTITGFKTGYSLTEGYYNTLAGAEAGYMNSTGKYNTFTGYLAGYNNIGYFSGSRQEGDYNTFTGEESGYSNTYGDHNEFYGKKSGYSTTTGYRNDMYGSHAGHDNTTGYYNDYFGGFASYSNTKGVGNVTVGDSAAYFAGQLGGSSNLNVVIGYHAFNSNSVGNLNTIIGAGADAPNGTSISNAGAFGDTSKVMQNNTVILGNNTQLMGIGLSGVAQGPQANLEIRTDKNPSPPAGPYPTANGFLGLGVAATSNPYSGTGFSGLKFTDLTSNSTPVLASTFTSVANPYPTGVLSVDGYGNVIYVPASAGAGAGYCSTGGPTTLTGNAGYNLNNVSNFYFQGNSSGSLTYNNVSIGNPCTYLPLAKLDVLQSSGTTSSIGAYINNTDVNSGCSSAPVMGLYSQVPNMPASGNITSPSIAGFFNAPDYGDGTSCTCGQPMGNFALLVPAATGYDGTYQYGGYVGIGVPYPYDYTCTDGSSFVGNYFANLVTINGDIGAAAYNSFSDSTLKKDITPLPNELQKVKSLRPVTYQWKKPTDTSSYGTHYGFIAQQVDTVFPNAVHHFGNGIYTMSYIDIIPILTKALQQEDSTVTSNHNTDSVVRSNQQQTIDSLRSVLSSIQTCIDSLCNSHSEHHRNGNQSSGDNNPASGETNVQNVTLSGLADAPLLYQNIPNPFSTGTKINYYLPQGTMGATIVFYDSYGNQIKQLQLGQTGNGTLNITPDNLTNGIYSYSLIVNGTVIDTKRMVLQK